MSITIQEANPTPLSAAQRKVWVSPARFRILVAGRRFGKSFLDIHELVRAARQRPKNNQPQRAWFIAPSYRQAKQVIWGDLMRLIPKRMIAKKDESDLSIRLAGYEAEIALRGADSPDSLRGPGLNFVVFDEYADIDARAWPEVVRPMLSDRHGEALFTGTPRGFDHFFKLYQKARPEDGWAKFQFTTLEGGNVPAWEVEAARRDLDPRIFRQEYEASFEAVAGRVYDSFERRHNCGEYAEDNGSTLHIGMDFNVNPMTAVLASKVGDELHVHHEIVIPHASTSDMVRAIDDYMRKWRVARSRERGDGRAEKRSIVVYPDPSGSSRRTSAPAGQTDFTLLRAAGYNVVAGKMQPAVVDRINEVNALCCNAVGRRRLHVHPRCVNVLTALEGLTYKEGTSQPDKDSGLDHIGDALGYMVHQMFPIIQRTWAASTLGIAGV